MCYNRPFIVYQHEVQRRNRVALSEMMASSEAVSQRDTCSVRGASRLTLMIKSTTRYAQPGESCLQWGGKFTKAPAQPRYHRNGMPSRQICKPEDHWPGVGLGSAAILMSIAYFVNV